MPLHKDVATTETNFNVRSSMAKNRVLGLWRLLRGYRPHYISAIISLGLAALSVTSMQLLLRYFVDDVLVNTPDNFVLAVLGVALAYVLLALMNGSFWFLSGKLTAQTAEGVALRLKDFLFDHLQYLNFVYHDNMKTGELIQRVTSDLDAIRRFYAEQAVGIGRIVFLFSANFIALLTLHWQLALISVMVIPVVFVMSLFFFSKLATAWEAFQEQEGRLSAVLQENLSGVRVVKAFARQTHEIDKFERENTERYRLGINFMKLHASYWPVVDILTGFQMIFGYYMASMLAINGSAVLGPIVLEGQITVGTYVAYSSMVLWIINPMRNLGRLIVQMSTGLVSYDRLIEIVREDRELLGDDVKSPVDAIEGTVRFENVNFKYTGTDTMVLEDISFEIEAGKTVALLGSTGSGKTSLVSLLPRFYEYNSGSITLDDIELTDYPKRFLRANIGIVEQEPFLFSRTIRENITYGVPNEVTDEDVIAAAKSAAVHDVIMTFPDGYNTLVGERGVTLSGGQKQRVALARTLLKNPRILILDDATSSVDTQTESDIRDALNTLMTGRTNFIIAHRIQSVMTADLVLVMDKGRIVQRGTHDSLMLEDGIYRRTYEMQARIEEELERELTGV